MLETLTDRRRMGDNELLLLKGYQCRDCGQYVEYLQALGSGIKRDVSCHQCGSLDLEILPHNTEHDYYW